MVALGITISDTQTGLKAARPHVFKNIFNKVLVKKYAFDAEVLAVASLYNFRIAEMPIDIELKKQFKLRDIARMFLDLAGIAYRLWIIKWYQKHLNEEDRRYRPIISL